MSEWNKRQRGGIVKRSPLRRKAPLRKKAKAKTNSWYKRQVVEQFMSEFRGLPCIICGSTLRTCGHHILAKGSHPAHIITPENIVVLCVFCHKFSNHMAPHSSNQFAVERFCQWMKENRAEQYAWCKAHEYDKMKHNWKEIYETQV